MGSSLNATIPTRFQVPHKSNSIEVTGPFCEKICKHGSRSLLEINLERPYHAKKIVKLQRAVNGNVSNGRKATVTTPEFGWLFHLETCPLN